jgi:5'-nucleotidase
MLVDFSEILVIGVSSRALFNLEEENEVFQNEGIEAFRKFQFDNEDKALEPRAAFYLIKSLLQLNSIAKKQIVEEVVFVNLN